MNSGPCRRSAVIVLGMHRSGTSAVARLIGYLGAALPADPIEAHAHNPTGFWESAAMVRADDRLLRSARSSWFDPRPLDLSRLEPSALRSCRDRLWGSIAGAYGDAPLFVIKDPRQCRFVPLVVETLAEHDVAARAVLMLRSPQAVAQSLRARDGTTLPFAQLLWLRHIMEAERDSRMLRRAIVGYDALLNDWRGTAGRLLALLDRDGLPQDKVADIEAFLTPDLRHHQETCPTGVAAPLAGMVQAVWTALQALLEHDDDSSRSALDAAYARFNDAPWLMHDIIHDELRHYRVKAASTHMTAGTV